MPPTSIRPWPTVTSCIVLTRTPEHLWALLSKGELKTIEGVQQLHVGRDLDATEWDPDSASESIVVKQPSTPWSRGPWL